MQKGSARSAALGHAWPREGTDTCMQRGHNACAKVPARCESVCMFREALLISTNAFKWERCGHVGSMRECSVMKYFRINRDEGNACATHSTVGEHFQLFADTWLSKSAKNARSWAQLG